MTYKEELNAAVKAALEGDIDRMYGQLNIAGEMWKEGDKPPFAEVKPGIEYIGLDRGLVKKIEEGRVPAIRGEKAKVAAHIKLCEGYAQQIGAHIGDKVQDLRNALDQTRLPKILERARQAIRRSNLGEADEHIEAARKYAGEVDISDLIAESRLARPDGLDAQINGYINEAVDYARRGCEKIAGSRVRLARELAGRYEVDISEQETKVENAGYEWQMGEELKNASQFAKQGKQDDMAACIERAKEHAGKLKLDIGKDVAKIEKKLKN